MNNRNSSEWSLIEFNHIGLNLKGKKSGQIKTTCPFCKATRTNKNDTSVSVNIDSGQYTCHHCGATGNMNKYRAKETNFIRPVWNNRTELSDKAVRYFGTRGISQTTLRIAKVTEQSEWMPQVEKEVNTICFNYFKDGELVNVKYRDDQKHFKMVKDAEKTWYNHDAIYNDELIIVEGEIDALSFIEAGIQNVVSVPNGAKNYEFFDIETLDKIKKVFIAVDNDTAGLQLQTDLIRRIGAERCMVIDFGECKDANEYLTKHGKLNLADCLKKAKDVPISGIIYVHDYLREIADMYENGLRPGLKLDHSKLSDHLSFETGRLMIVTGIPGHGKSEFVDEICIGMAIKHQWTVGYFSPENWPPQLHISKLIAKATGKWIQNNNKDELSDATEFLDRHFYWVMPENEDTTLDIILGKAEYLVKKHGIKIFVIDPWNTIEFQLDGMTETQYINKALSQITTFAKRMDILMILVAHPTKMQVNVDEKKNKSYDIPNLYSINGSSHFYNKADFGLTVYRTPQDDVQIHVQKVKFRHLGHTGMVLFRNNVSNGRYQEIFPGYIPTWDNTNRLIETVLQEPDPYELITGKDAVPF